MSNVSGAPFSYAGDRPEQPHRMGPRAAVVGRVEPAIGHAGTNRTLAAVQGVARGTDRGARAPVAYGGSAGDRPRTFPHWCYRRETAGPDCAATGGRTPPGGCAN